MGLAISVLTSQMTMNVQSDCEYLLTRITNTLSRMAMEAQTIVEQQTAAGQAYMAAHTDEEGEPTAEAIEWVNSTAFNAMFEAKLKEIQAKEQVLNMQKQQIETKQKMYSTQNESWEKTTQSNVEEIFKYGN